MSSDEDELLVRALGDLGGTRGRRGAEAGARHLRKNVFEIDLVVNAPPQVAADRARQVIDQQGSVKSLEGTGEDSDAQVIGIVGSGTANLNPAVVTVTIHRAAEGSRLVIRGAAKEGMIKQRAGEKAAKRVAAAMTAAGIDPRTG